MFAVQNPERTSFSVPVACRRRRRARAAAGLAVVGAIGLVSSGAGAAPELFVSLEYEADPELEPCPSQEQFRRSVSEQLGYDPFRDGAPHHVLVRAQAATQGSAGLLRWLDASGAVEGERHLTSPTPSCDDLVRELAFAVVVQIQLFIAAAPPEPTPPAAAAAAASEQTSRPSTPSAPSGAAPGAGRPPPVEVVPTASERWSGSWGVGPFVAYGLSPKVNGWGRVFGEVRYGAASLEVGAEASLRWVWRQSDGSGFTGQVAMATLAPCLHTGALLGCPVAKLGVMQVRGVGVDEVKAPLGVLAQAGLRIGAVLEAGEHIMCVPRAEALWTLTERTVELNAVGVWTTPAVTVLGGLDVAYRF